MSSSYKRILFKISGEALMGNQAFGHDINVLKSIAYAIKDVINLGVELCIIVGGGNIYRGTTAAQLGIQRSVADYMGMLGTILNALALQSIMEEIGVSTRVMSALPILSVCETYIRRKAHRHIEKKRVVIFAAGTGNPFFSTDTAAVLRAIEMNCSIVLKGTQVDGVYSADPKKDPTATKYQHITYDEMLKYNLNVMDMSAIALARDNNLPIKVFSIKDTNNILRVVMQKGDFTIISKDEYQDNKI